MRTVPIHTRVLTRVLWMGAVARHFQETPALHPRPVIINQDGKVIQ